jgi:hypothetical protein
MKHAGADTLAELAGLLTSIREVAGLVEKANGVFYRKGQAFLHFHEDPTGLYADVKIAGVWQRHAVQSPEQRSSLAELVSNL